MHLSVASISTLPEFGVTHSSQEVVDLLLLVLSVGLNLQTINLLQDLSLFVQKELKGKLLLLLAKFGRSFDLFGFVKAPRVELVTEDLEVLALGWVHTSLNLFLMLNFLLVAEISLLGLKLVILVGTLLTKAIGCPSGEPSTDMALDFESGIITLLLPHGRGHILARVDNLIVSLIDIDTWLLHLDAEFAHHLGGLGLVLVSLNLALDLVRVEVSSLIGLCERVMVGDSGPVVPETSKVGLRSLLLFNSDSHDLDLVVGKADLNFELVGHDEFVGFN